MTSTALQEHSAYRECNLNIWQQNQLEKIEQIANNLLLENSDLLFPRDHFLLTGKR